MAHILITSGPTRQYLDPVRYLTNASSGRMGAALAEVSLARGHQVTIVSGPVTIDYPPEARVFPVTSTEEMLATYDTGVVDIAVGPDLSVVIMVSTAGGVHTLHKTGGAWVYTEQADLGGADWVGVELTDLGQMWGFV